MAKTRLVELLNRALQEEYTDIFLYSREADIIKDKAIAEKFERFGRMELRHADNVAMQIQILDGTPAWEFLPLAVEKSLDKILRGHLERETAGIRLYEELIKLSDGEGKDQVKLIMKGIKAEEEGHLKVIKEMLSVPKGA